MGTCMIMQTVHETPVFTRKTEKSELIDFVAKPPVAPQKVKFAATGRGKRNRVRIIYFYLNDGIPIYALLGYAKNAKRTCRRMKRKRSAH